MVFGGLSNTNGPAGDISPGPASAGRHRAIAEHPVRDDLVQRRLLGAGPSPDTSLRAIPRGPRNGVAISPLRRLPRRPSLRSVLLAMTRGRGCPPRRPGGHAGRPVGGPAQRALAVLAWTRA